MRFLATTSAPVRLQRADGVQRATLAADRPLWLVGADLSVYTRLDLRAVPARHRARAIAERARQLSPFATPAWHAADRDGDVLLWCWDGARVGAAMADADGPPQRREVLPEQVFFTPVEGACVRALGEASLLECWQDGALAFSALLPADPRERALRLRAAGLAPDASLASAPATLAVARWDRPTRDWRQALRDPVAGIAAALGLASLWLLWSLAELGGTHLANARIAAALAEQEESLAPLLEQRDRALTLSSRNRALSSQFAQADALEAAAEFEHLAGPRYQKLLQWEYNGRVIRAILEDSSPDNRAYVEAITQSPWFPRVSVTPGLRPEQINLEIAFGAAAGAQPRYIGTPAAPEASP